MTVTDDELNEGLSPVNNFQPTGQPVVWAHITDVNKLPRNDDPPPTIARAMEAQADDVVEPTAEQATAPKNNQTSVGEVVQVEPLQPDGQDSEEAAGQDIDWDKIPLPPGVIDVKLDVDKETKAKVDAFIQQWAETGQYSKAPLVDYEPKGATLDTKDVRPPSLEEVSKKPPTEVAPMVSGQPKMETPVSTARANQESAPADNRYGIESRPVITIVDAKNTNKTAQETPMGDEEWNTSQATDATPNPVEVTRTDLKSMPLEEDDFEARYRNWEKVHASRQASILAKMMARDDKYAEMESTIDAENEKLAGFKVDRLG